MLVKTPKLKLRENISRLLWKGLFLLNTNRSHSSGEESFLHRFFSYIAPQYSSLTILDCGANKGGYTDWVLQAAKSSKANIQVHLFEPQKKCYEWIHKKYEGNGNICINNLAVCNKERVATFYTWDERDPLGSLHDRSNLIGKNLTGTEKVQTIRLDNYIRKHSLEHIHLIKLDIEGNEMNAIEGLGDYLNSEYIDCIQFEYGGCNLNSGVPLKNFFDLLENKGFAVCKLFSNDAIKTRYKPWLEDYSYSNYIAIAKKFINC